MEMKKVITALSLIKRKEISLRPVKEINGPILKKALFRLKLLRG